MTTAQSNHPCGNVTVDCTACSSTGKEREENEDSYLIDPEKNLFIVSDGMGGHAEGATASQLVVKSLPLILTEKFGRLRGKSRRSIFRAISKSIVELNKKVRTEGAKGNGVADMGATLVMALLRDDRIYIANVGDSRAYLFRNNRLRRLTMDHTIVAEMVEQGYIEPSEAQKHPQQHVITQCVGVDAGIKPYRRSLAVRKDDRLLLCSDGLTVVVPDGQIKKILRSHFEPQSACKALVGAANTAGGPDNITVLIFNLT